jgi:hypothetical protein
MLGNDGKLSHDNDDEINSERHKRQNPMTKH